MLPVKISKPEQFRYESKTWNRLLEFFKQENTFLKNRLAEVVDDKTGRDFLSLAENFQNRFILKDEIIDELRKEISLQVLGLGNCKNILADDTLMEKQEKLRTEIEYFERDFNKLKNEFNKYLSSVL